MLTQDFLKSILHYDSETGVFTRTVLSGNAKIGSVAGTINANGYRSITINYKQYYAHRLVWFYIHGAWPKNMIDHINGKKDDNRICNLREATRSENMQNQLNHSFRNKCGYLGVYFNKEKRKYQAQIQINGKVKNLGRYGTPEEAHEAYLKAKRDIHEFCTI